MKISIENVPSLKLGSIFRRIWGPRAPQGYFLYKEEMVFGSIFEVPMGAGMVLDLSGMRTKKIRDLFSAREFDSGAVS